MYGWFYPSNTLSENGPRTRGVCTVDANGYLSKVTETYDVYKAEDGMHAADHDGNPVIVKRRPARFHEYVRTAGIFRKRTGKRIPGIPLRRERGDLKAEYLLPAVIDSCIHNVKGTVRVLETKDKMVWCDLQRGQTGSCRVDPEAGRCGCLSEKLF